MRRPAKNGFSLVEALVAAALLSLSIIMIVAVIKNGRAIDINDLHRRQARAIINGVLGSPHYDYTNYVYLHANPGTKSDSTVTLDPRDGSSPLTGALKIQTIVVPSGGTIPFDVVKIIITVTWQEPEFPDSIVIEKWVTEA
jgi:hypothetical protein